jgi:hypothetical protein
MVCNLFQDVALLELRCLAHESKDPLSYYISPASSALMFHLWIEFYLVMKTPCHVDALMGTLAPFYRAQGRDVTIIFTEYYPGHVNLLQKIGNKTVVRKEFLSKHRVCLVNF